MATELDTLLAKIDATMAPLRSELQKTTQAMAKMMQESAKETEKLNATLDKVASRIKTAIGGALAGLSISKLTSMTRESLKWAETLQQQAKWLGISVENLQAYENGARDAGVEQGKFGLALEKMMGNLADAAADPQSNPALIFRQLGISLRDANGELKTADTILPQLADKIAGLGKGDKLVVGKTLFGDRMDEVVRVLAGGSTALAKMRDEFNRLNPGFAATVQRGAEMNREFEKITDQIGLQLKQALIDLGPILTEILDIVLKITGALGEAFRRAGILSSTPLQMLAAKDKEIDVQRDILGFNRGQKTMDPAGLARLRKLEAERESIAQEAVADNFRGLPAATGPRGPADKLTRGGEDEFTKKIQEMQREAKALLDNLNFDPATASYKKLMAEFEAGNGKIVPTRKQVEEFGEALRLKMSREGLVALKDMREEAIASAEAAQLEALGQKEAAEALRIKFELTRRYGPEFAAAQAGWIDQLVRYKAEMAKIAERTRAATQEMESLFDSFASSATSEMDAFFNRQKTGWEALRDFAIKALHDIANEILKLGVLNPIKNAVFPNSNLPTLGDFLGGGTQNGLKATGGGFLGEIGDWIGSLFRAEGGPVMAGSPYIVGEKGPELFMPNMSGTIVPNSKVGGGIVNLYGSDSDKIEIGQLKAGLRALGLDVRQMKAGEGMRVRAHMADVAREGGAVTNLYR